MMSAVNGRPTFEQSAADFLIPSGETEWLGLVRQKAAARFRTLGFPTRRNEAWKYQNLEAVLKFETRGTDAGFPSFDSRWASMQNVILDDLAASAKKHADKVRPYLAKNIDSEENAFAALNAAQFQKGIFLFVPKETPVQIPAELLFKPAGVSHSRLLIVLEAGSKAQVILRFENDERESSLTNTVAEVFLGANANLQIVAVQKESQKAFQFLTVRAHQEQGSRFDFVSVTNGGRSTRNEVLVEFEGENASCSLDGLALMEGDSQIFQHAWVNHRVPNCVSRQVYKNILSGKAQAEFNSMVHVFRGANQSDSQQLDRNLILSDEARAWSRPQLKIDADDVKANHGAATGQLEDSELFYLRSRGLQKKYARYLLTYSFAQDVLNAIQDETLRRGLEAWTQEHVRQMIEGVV